MKKTLPALAFALSLPFVSSSQSMTQYFDGADTNVFDAIILHLDSTDVWQIGPPQKNYFESASTVPNVLITDTLLSYPDSVSASAWFNLPYDLLYWTGFVAIQWNQKLDLDTLEDGGFVEFSSDSGLTWENAFYNSNVYNFYGWDSQNEGYDYTGNPCFTGTDTVWKNIWLCFSYDYLYTIDNLFIRFRLSSDTITTNQEGWMIDNLMAQPTYFHPVAEQSMHAAFKVYPTISDGMITIQQRTEQLSEEPTTYRIISTDGREVRSETVLNHDGSVNLQELSPGNYIVILKSGKLREMHEIIISGH